MYHYETQSINKDHDNEWKNNNKERESKSWLSSA